MKLEDVQPAHCYARAQRLLAETALVRDEMGRSADARPALELSGALPRDCYFEALATWRKADRLGDELGARSSTTLPPAPSPGEIRPGHVLGVIDAVQARLDQIKGLLEISERANEPAIEGDRQPSDVLVTLVRVNRELSRALERPFTPSDVYGIVALASTYASRIGSAPKEAPFERKRKPQSCYERLSSCLAILSKQIEKRGQTALASRDIPADVLPGDVYDIANLVLGEVAYLHSLSKDAKPMFAFEPASPGRRLPAHVDQLARVLEAQLSALT